MRYYFELFSVSIFALSGIQQARLLQMNFYGHTVFALVTALGGGTLRDLLLLQCPLFWIIDPMYVVVSLLTCVVGGPFLALLHRMPYSVLPLLDAIGVALFVSIGAHKALLAGHGPFVTLCAGFTTGIGGGMLCDQLKGAIPTIFYQQGNYATACLLGSISYMLASASGIQQNSVVWMSILITFVVRCKAIYSDLKKGALEGR